MLNERKNNSNAQNLQTQGAIFPNAKLVKCKVNPSINVFGKNLPHVKKGIFWKFSPPFFRSTTIHRYHSSGKKTNLCLVKWVY